MLKCVSVQALGTQGFLHHVTQTACSSAFWVLMERGKGGSGWRNPRYVKRFYSNKLISFPFCSSRPKLFHQLSCVAAEVLLVLSVERAVLWLHRWDTGREDGLAGQLEWLSDSMLQLPMHSLHLVSQLQYQLLLSNDSLVLHWPAVCTHPSPNS